MIDLRARNGDSFFSIVAGWDHSLRTFSQTFLPGQSCNKEIELVKNKLAIKKTSKWNKRMLISANAAKFRTTSAHQQLMLTFQDYLFSSELIFQFST